MPETKQINTLPLWVDNLAVHEAERIYEMIPRMLEERTKVIARLAAGIMDLLSSEIGKRTA